MLEVPAVPVADAFPRYAVRISMSSPISATCPHGLRPGTNVCLRCRYEARAADRKRRYFVVARVAIAASGVVVAISLLIGAVMAIAPDTRSSSAAEATQAGNVVQASALAASRPAAISAPDRTTPKAVVEPAAKLEPRIAEG